ncbi:OLC1v1013945C1 [Oldenlandia corymbosa var. corymbosa]|uniref:OLC1v1013945C1 n=1 Tax=Oldenlandia corymbosa var. corymbosa TaxID=529605 RepID=A0AAV1DZQ3_OLDCO|nr:OLC1v1013945C1 [Oldenlandia corymbosa var. corymbosa]
MKNKVLFGFSYLIFIIFQQTNLCICSAKSQPPAVRDLAGKELRGRIPGYFILPAVISGSEIDGVLLSNETCPPHVIQENIQENNATHFKRESLLSFNPLDMKKGVIRTSSDINIGFLDASEDCTSSLVWKVQEKDPLTGNYYVGVGGVVGNPGPQTVNNWFKIEKTKLAYKLRFCPSVCKTCKVMCKDIGIVKDKNGKRRLALSDVPFEVTFRFVV